MSVRKFYCNTCFSDFVQAQQGNIVRVRQTVGEAQLCVDCGEPCVLEVVGVESKFV